MITWTKSDERHLKDLLDRKAAFTKHTREPLLKVTTLIGQSYGRTIRDPDKFVDAMIVHSEQIRDALAPYDSGERCALKKDDPSA